MAFDELAAKGYIEGNGRKGTIVVNNNENASIYAPPPNWQSYYEKGLHYPNLPAIQEINQAEFYPHVIRLEQVNSRQVFYLKKDERYYE